MQLEHGKTYVCKNMAVVKIEKSSLPHYKFKANKINHGDGWEDCKEVWTDKGVAYDYCLNSYEYTVVEQEIEVK